MLITAAGLAIYIGAYRALLYPMIIADVGHLGWVVEGSREPNYRYLNDACRFIFAPLERIDYTIRPDFWDHYSNVPQTQ